MMRRALLVLAIAACCTAADPAGEVLDLFTDVAASLTARNAPRFLAAFDPAMPGYATLRDNVAALMAQGEAQSFMDPLENEGGDNERTVEWKWTLRLRRGQDATPSLLREGNVKASVVRRGGKWRITKLEPIAFFAPGN